MTVINPLASTAAAPTPRSDTMLDQADFLRLMTTQLTTQDPFNPVDNQQMVAQMAQFSSVAGIAEMNKSLRTIAEGMGPSRLTDAASWIGRSMLVQSDVAVPQPDGAYAGEVALAEDADQVTISLVDEKGAVMHSQTLGAQAKGPVAFAWNGRNAAGETAAAGPLRVVVSASKGNDVVETATATWTRIGGIQSPASGGATRLVTGLGLLSPEEAIRLA